MPPACRDRHTIEDHGQPVTLTCAIDAGHPGTHQAYYRDRLHSWPSHQAGKLS